MTRIFALLALLPAILLPGHRADAADKITFPGKTYRRDIAT